MRLVLFDLDGTLLRGHGAGRESMEAALAEAFGSAGDPEYHYDGKTDRQIVRETMRAAGHDDAAIDAQLEAVIAGYLRRVRERLSSGAARVTQLAGVAPLLDALERRADVVLGVLTGNVADGAALKLEAAGIDASRFRVNAFGSDHEHRRRLPEIAQQRARDDLGLDLTGDAIVVIGDTPADIDCARSIGARTIGVATGRYSVAELAEHGPTAVVADLTDTDAVVAAILS